MYTISAEIYDLLYSAKDYGREAAGLDLNVEFVEAARRRNRGLPIRQADMTQFQLHERYDAVLCLFSSIGYVQTLEQVRQTIRQMKQHMSEGGLCCLSHGSPRSK